MAMPLQGQQRLQRASFHSDESLLKIADDNYNCLEGMDISACVRNSHNLFDSIIKTDSAETQAQLQTFFDAPMEAISKAITSAIERLPVDESDPAKVEERLQVMRLLMERVPAICDDCLENVFAPLAKKLELFEVTIDAWNEKLEETVDKALQLYVEKAKAEVAVRRATLPQRQEEHAAALQIWLNEGEAQAQQEIREAETKTQAVQKALERQRKCDEQRDTNVRKERERSVQKAQKELERQAKQIDLAHRKALSDVEREHRQAISTLERHKRKGKLDGAEHARVMQELEVARVRYAEEWNLARDAMRRAIQKGGRCRITHTAPRIDWKPFPIVVPGTISWKWCKS